MSQLDPERRRVLAVLRRHGWNVTSFQVLEPGFQYWFADEDACVAYVDTGRSWVAAGAPLTEPARLREVAEAFHRRALEARRRLAFFAVEQRVVKALDWRSLNIGEQPRNDRLVTRKMSRWSTWATPAASRPTPTDSAQMYAVTFAACGAMFAWARPGLGDGATGSPSAVEPVLAGPSATASRPGA
jgi:hypothetical protein